MMKNLKVGDYLVIALIIISSILIFFLTRRQIEDVEGKKYVRIEVNGSEYSTIEFTEDTNQIINVDTQYGHNKVQIKDNSVINLEADCLNQLCVLQGAIYQPGEMIVCLPNRMVVEIIVENNEESDLDVIVQ